MEWIKDKTGYSWCYGSDDCLFTVKILYRAWIENYKVKIYIKTPYAEEPMLIYDSQYLTLESAKEGGIKFLRDMAVKTIALVEEWETVGGEI